MKLNYKLIAMHLITIGAWGCFLVGLLLAIMSNGHNRFNNSPLNHHIKFVIPAINSSERKLYDFLDTEEKGVKKKRLYSKMYSRVSLKVDEDAFVRTKSKLSRILSRGNWLKQILFR